MSQISTSLLTDYVSRCKTFNKSRTVATAAVFNVPLSVLAEVGIFCQTAPSSASLPASMSETAGISVSLGIASPVLARGASLGRSCSTCGLQFDDIAEQQAHCKSARHQSNLRRQLRGLPARPPRQVGASKVGASASTSRGKSGEGDGDGDSVSDNSSISSYDDDDDTAAAAAGGGGGGGGSGGGGGDDDDDDDASDNDDREAEALAAREEEEDEGRMRVGKPSTSVHSPAGVVHWGAYSPRDGLQATFCPASSSGSGGLVSRWNVSVNNVLLQVQADASIAAAKADNEGESSPWERLGATVNLLRQRPLSCVLILRSGKFAGVVFDGSAIIEHKIFRRYTRRAKAGGAQSSYDKKAGKANSAGAQMRRAGEAALKSDVANLLKAWRNHIDEAGMILISVPRAMRNVIFEDGAPNAVLRKTDARIITVPFLVRQPTFAEAQVVHTRCTTVMFSKAGTGTGTGTAGLADGAAGAAGGRTSAAAASAHAKDVGAAAAAEMMEAGELQEAIAELALAALERGAVMQRELWDARSRERARRRDKQASKIKKQREGETMLAMANAFEARITPCSDDLFSCIRLGDASAAARILEHLQAASAVPTASLAVEGVQLMRQGSNDSTLSFASTASEGEDLLSVLRRPESLDSLSTPLHIAAVLGRAAICSLLLEAGANPGVVDARGRNAYALALDKATRAAFRKSRAVVEETPGAQQWDWDEAGVGPALTEEGEQARKDALKEKEKEKKKRAKQRKQEQAQAESQQQADAELARAMLEQDREAMKLAAQAAAGECPVCKKSLYQVKAVAAPDARCCSEACALRYKRNLAAAAAEKRLKG